MYIKWLIFKKRIMNIGKCYEKLKLSGHSALYDYLDQIKLELLCQQNFIIEQNNRLNNIMRRLGEIERLIKSPTEKL